MKKIFAVGMAVVIVAGIWMVTRPKADRAGAPDATMTESAATSAATDATVTTPEAGASPIALAPGNHTLTEQELTGAKYKVDQVVMEFAADHKWTVNGEAKALWSVEGNRLRIYDTNGEEHFLDISGDKVTFEGQPVELTR